MKNGLNVFYQNIFGNAKSYLYNTIQITHKLQRAKIVINNRSDVIVFLLLYITH